MTELDPLEADINAADIMDELDKAIRDHTQWIADWHRSLLCTEPPLTSELAHDPGHLCPFGTWLMRNQHKGLANQPAMKHLARTHEKLHNEAKSLLDVAAYERPLPRDAYSAFMDTYDDFLSQARRMEKAFTQATSDLDPLTGLHNRHALVRELQREHERVSRTKNSCCIAIGDLDHFKAVNDTHGHHAGDRVLVASASIFLKHLRAYDSVYRQGGEEFLFCLPDANAKMAKVILDRLRESLAETEIPIGDGKTLKVTGSFGIAEMAPDLSVRDTMERADLALYQAKNSGRNQIWTWDQLTCQEETET